MTRFYLLMLLAAVSFASIDAAEPIRMSVDPNYAASRMVELVPPKKDELELFIDNNNFCYGCHLDNGTSKTYEEQRHRVTMIETSYWQDRDYHADALKKLDGDRAQKIGEILKIDVKKDLRCINCHSGHYLVQGDSLDARTAPVLQRLRDSEAFSGSEKPNDPAAKTILGQDVSCQACHGPARGWSNTHQNIRDWWKKDSSEKYKAGLLDVRHPVSRAQVCLSCHLGSSREGKILTHDMYAAGHPPLPSFEIESFMSGMPQHGYSIEVKTSADKSPDSHGDWYTKGEMYRTRSALTASLVALQMQAQLIADQARWYRAEKATLSQEQYQYEAQWPELAIYDCSACHHDLRLENKDDSGEPAKANFVSWRQERGHQGNLPGRPMYRAWPTALYRVAGIDPKILSPLQDVFNAQPFGNPPDVAIKAQEVADALAKEITKFDEAIKPDRALNLLKSLCVVGAKNPPTFDEARQLAWAAQIIVKELVDAGNRPNATPLISPDQLPKIETILKAWDEELILTLTERVSGNDVRTPLVVNSAALEKAREFGPRAFQAKCSDLVAILGEPK